LDKEKLSPYLLFCLLNTPIVKRQIEEKTFVLEQGNNIKGIVVDVNNNPIEGAMVYSEKWKGYRALDWTTYTDSQGRFVWNEAPSDKVQINVNKTGFIEFDNPNESMTPSEQEYLIVLRDPIKVTGTVVDANTGLAIENFKLFPGWKQYTSSNNSVTFQNSIGGVRTYADSKFKYTFTSDGQFYGIKVKADGYATALSRNIDPNEQNVVLNFELHKEDKLFGTVVNQANEPVSRATVYFFENVAHIENNVPANIYPELTAKTDDNGLFTFEELSEYNGYTLLVATDKGIAVVLDDEFKQDQRIVLKPFGSIAGTFYIGTKPAQNQKLVFNHTDSALYPRLVHIQYTTVTDTNGVFMIDRVRVGNMNYGSNMTFDVESGQTTHLTLGGNGRIVTGYLLPPAGIKMYDIINGLPVISLSSISPYIQKSPIPLPQNYEQMTYIQANEWLKQYSLTEQGKILINQFQEKYKRVYYRASMDNKGCFIFENVVPGKYLLKATANKRNGLSIGFETIAKVAIEFEVPPIEYLEQMDETLDIGMIEMIKGTLEVGDDAPDFQVPAINRNGLIKLDDFKGKYLLINFFNSYIAKEQPQHLDIFRQINNTAKTRADFQMVNIYLDSPLAGFLLEKIIAQHNIDCPYGIVHHYDNLIEVIYNVSNLPYSVLIDPQGKVISIGLKQQQLIDNINDTLP